MQARTWDWDKLEIDLLVAQFCWGLSAAGYNSFPIVKGKGLQNNTKTAEKAEKRSFGTLDLEDVPTNV